MTYSNKKSQSGLSAIEMVLVFAAIAILASMIFPVYLSVRQKARKATCLSNLKQLGQAFMLYQTTYARIPWSYDGADNWYDILSDDNLIETISGNIGIKKGFYCPEYVVQYGEPTGGAGDPLTTYCMPTIHKDMGIDMFGSDYTASRTFLLSERKNSGSAEGWALGSQTNYTLHDGRGSNYLFMDGHVAFLTQNQASSTSTVTGYCWPNTLLGTPEYC